MSKQIISSSRNALVIDTCLYEDAATVADVADRLQLLAETPASPLALVVLNFSFGLHSVPTNTRVQHSITYYLEQLRPRIRRTDVVLLHAQTVYFLLPAASIQGGALVQERLWETLLWSIHTSPDEILRPTYITIGHNAYPTPSTEASQCIANASVPLQSITPSTPGSTMSYQDCEHSHLSLLARQSGMPYLPLLPRILPKRVQKVVDKQLAQELHCLPLGYTRNTLTVAIADPQQQCHLQRLQQQTGLRIFPVLTDPIELQSALKLLN